MAIYPYSEEKMIRELPIKENIDPSSDWIIVEGKDGTKRTLIEQVISKSLRDSLFYDSLQDMINATNIVEDSIVYTRGFSVPGDGGGAKYEIVYAPGEVPDGYFKQITLTFNPWSATSWLKARFFDTPDEDTFTKTTTWQCNEWLDEADRNIFLKMKVQNPRRYRIEGDGDWGIAEGLIYTNVRVEEFDVDEIRKIKGIKAAFNLDFGFTDPNAFVCEMVDNVAMRIYIFDEWYKTGVTNKIIAEQIKKMGYGGQRIVCDSAEPKSIAELQDEGINAEPSRKGKDSVNHGIQLIQNYEIVVHPRCTEFYKEISNYCWAKDKDGKLTDKPDHEFSHGMDSMRYGVSKLLLPDVFSFD